MIQLALWVASAIFLALVGWFVLCAVGGIIVQIIGALCDREFWLGKSSTPSRYTYQEPIDPNAEIKSRVMKERQAIAGPRKDGESLVQYFERLTAVKL